MQRVTSAGMILHLQRWVSSVGTTRGSRAMSLLFALRSGARSNTRSDEAFGFVRQPSSIEPVRDQAEPVLPTPMRRRASDAEPPADQLPGRALGARPDQLGVLGFEPAQPPERFLHPADRGRRWRRQPHRLGLLADPIGELHDHGRPCVEVARHAHRRQTPDHRRGFGEALLDQVRGRIGRTLIGSPTISASSTQRIFGL